MTRSPQVAERIQQRGQDSFRSSHLGLHKARVSDFAMTFQPQGLCMLLAYLCLFFLVNLTESRWGTLQIEQARDVLTKLERKVKLFLSLAKEPFSKTPPNTDKMAFIPLSFLGNDIVSDAVPLILSSLS